MEEHPAVSKGSQPPKRVNLSIGLLPVTLTAGSSPSQQSQSHNSMDGGYYLCGWGTPLTDRALVPRSERG